MRTLSVTTEVAAPTERVWQVMSDVERWQEWTPSVKSIRLLDAGPLALGSRAVVRQPKFPPARWKVTAIESGLGFTWVSLGPGIRVIARHSIESADGGSRVTLSVDYGGILGGLMARLTGDITERYLGFEAKGLRARSEDPGFRHELRTPGGAT